MQVQGNSNLKEFVLIEYPAVVNNLEKAIETLGGLGAISNAHFSTTPLELQFRRDNPYHSSLVADRRNQGVIFSGQLNLVLRCRRRKPKPATDEGASGKKKETKEADQGEEAEMKCLGMVSTIYSFRSICDFQYLPLSNSSVEHQSVQVHHDLLPSLIPTDFPSSLTWFDEQPKQQLVERITIDNASTSSTPSSSSPFTSAATEVQAFLPPYQFSRYNNPCKFLLRDEVDRRALGRQNIGHGKSLRAERKALTITVNARDPFPAEPSNEALQDVELRCKNEEHHRMLAALFAERPLWSRIAISFRTHINDALLKVILAKYAFYIMSGPWGRLWCRFGYDPRLDPEARKYQSTMVSFKRNQYIPERQRLRANTTAAGTVSQGQFCDYIYRPGVLPGLRQIWYCICDVQLPLALKICNRGYLETLREFDPVYGWLPSGRLNAVRRAIKEDVALTSRRLGDMGEGTMRGGDEFEEEYLDLDDEEAGMVGAFDGDFSEDGEAEDFGEELSIV